MKTIALFVCDPKCSVQSSNGIINALGEYYKFKLFSKNEVEDNFFNDVDLIAVPGGFGDSDSFDTLLKHNGESIVKYVKSGTPYLGICMGAYWAGSYYFDILDGVDAVQYIKQPTATVKRSYGTVTEVMWNDKKTNMYFYDGCALIGDTTKFKTIARYNNGDAMAIIQRNIGIIGCHPESLQYWYETPWNYINKHWHKGEHHKLLLEFVDELMMSV